MRPTTYLSLAMIFFLSCSQQSDSDPTPEVSIDHVAKVNGVPLPLIGGRISYAEFAKRTSRRSNTRGANQTPAVIFGRKTLERLLSVRDMQAVYCFVPQNDTLQIIIVPIDSNGDFIFEQDGVSTVEDHAFPCPPDCANQ